MIRQVQCTRRVPKCPLFHLTRGFPHCSYLLLSAQSTPYTLSLSMSFSHAQPPLFILSHALVSSGCNELSTPAQQGVTEVFIKRTAIREVPRTGKSHSSEAPLWNRREGNKLGFGYGAALDD